MIDSLPYIDKITPNLLLEATNLIQSELSKSQPPPTPPINFPFFSETLKKEFKRIESNLPFEPLNFSNLNLKDPEEVDSEKVEVWKSALDNSITQLENQNLRRDNLELMELFGANKWKIWNYYFENEVLVGVRERVNLVREELRVLNRKRKIDQVFLFFFFFFLKKDFFFSSLG